MCIVVCVHLDNSKYLSACIHRHRHTHRNLCMCMYVAYSDHYKSQCMRMSTYAHTCMQVCTHRYCMCNAWVHSYNTKLQYKHTHIHTHLHTQEFMGVYEMHELIYIVLNSSTSKHTYIHSHMHAHAYTHTNFSWTHHWIQRNSNRYHFPLMKQWTISYFYIKDNMMYAGRVTKHLNGKYCSSII